jgi:hypothetical protein
MKEPNRIESHMTRRDFVGYTAAMAAIPLVPRSVFDQQDIKPDSKFNDVQIGAITYSFRAMPSTADDLLNYLIQCGISSIELMGEPAERFAGAPTFEQPQWPRRGEEITDEQRARFLAARQAQAVEMKEWRTSASMGQFEVLRRRYNDAGVNIHIVKFGDIGPNMSEDEHRIMIGFHNHTQVNASSWEAPLSHGEYLGINLDVGHYVAGTNQSPIPIIEKYADAGRILSLHIKDRKVNNGPNMPFGEGDTPLGLILQLMKRNEYTFPADVELEYEVPDDSDVLVEVKRCVEYCRNALADAPEPQNPMRPR